MKGSYLNNMCLAGTIKRVVRYLFDNFVKHYTKLLQSTPDDLYLFGKSCLVPELEERHEKTEVGGGKIGVRLRLIKKVCQLLDVVHALKFDVIEINYVCCHLPPTVFQSLQGSSKWCSRIS